MLRYVFAMHHPPFARSLGLPLTLPERAAMPASGSVSAPAAGPSVAITFDDGPHPEGTPAVLEVLAAHRATATFFVVGEQVVRRPALLRRMLDEGHAVALHGHRHRVQLRLTRRQLAEDLARGTAAIEDAIGASPRVHRPPFGIYSRAGLELVREAGLQPLLWSLWGKDWRRFTTAEQISRRALDRPQDGDVLLLHDADYYSARHSHRRTAEALPGIITTLRSAGLATVGAA